jgi:hypothetical protein
LKLIGDLISNIFECGSVFEKLSLKELIFFDICEVDWNNYKCFRERRCYSAPTLQMTMRWLREVHNIHIGINPISGKGYNATIYDVADFDDYGIISDTKFFFHVEQACEAAIKYCLENLI